jgi:hypothetical protein
MTDQQEHSDRLFIQQVSALLKERADGLDAPTRSRLNRARQAALDELDASQGFFGRHKFWAPAGGLVVASLFTAMVWVGGLQTGSQDLQGTLPSAIEMNAELLTVDEDFELLSELEFYNWLQSVPGGSV